MNCALLKWLSRCLQILQMKLLLIDSLILFVTRSSVSMTSFSLHQFQCCGFYRFFNLQFVIFWVCYNVKEAVRDITMKSPSSTCSLDPIPTWLLKKCINELLPIICKIINLSFVNGKFPYSLKSAHIKPLIKKPKLDTEVLKNYCLVANLLFLAKAIERAYALQIQDYLVNENLRGIVQSAYRPCYSTKTASLHVSMTFLLQTKVMKLCSYFLITLQPLTLLTKSYFLIAWLKNMDLLWIGFHHISQIFHSQLLSIILCQSHLNHMNKYHKAQSLVHFHLQCTLCLSRISLLLMVWENDLHE